MVTIKQDHDAFAPEPGIITVEFGTYDDQNERLVRVTDVCLCTGRTKNIGRKIEVLHPQHGKTFIWWDDLERVK